jgi:hypothetical protein
VVQAGHEHEAGRRRAQAAAAADARLNVNGTRRPTR